MPVAPNPYLNVDKALQLLKDSTISERPIKVIFEAAHHGNPLLAKKAARAFAQRCAATRIAERDKARKSEWGDASVPGPYACVHIATSYLDNGDAQLTFTRNDDIVFKVEAEDGSRQTWDEYKEGEQQ